MLCGITLGEDGNDSALAFLSNNIETFTVESNKEIVNLIEEFNPDVVAVDTGLEERKSLSEEEEKLQKQGFIFTPSKDDLGRVRRFTALKSHIAHEVTGDDIPSYIRFDPMITGKELAIDSDEALSGYGIDGSDINSSIEFDAVLGAVTARFHQEGQVKDLAVVVPKPVKNQNSQEIEKDPREGSSKKIPDNEDYT